MAVTRLLLLRFYDAVRLPSSDRNVLLSRLLHHGVISVTERVIQHIPDEGYSNITFVNRSRMN